MKMENSVADFFLQNVIRRGTLPPFFCHGCNHRFADSTSSSTEDPVCPQCGSDFVERVEQEEERTTGGGETATSVPLATASSTTITISGSRPRGAGTADAGGETPMELAEDPEPEIIGPREIPRRRPAPTTIRGSPPETSQRHQTDIGAMRGPFVRIRGPRGQPLAQMIHQHIENLMNPQRAAHQRSHEDHTDDGEDDTLPPSRRHRQHSSPPREGEEGSQGAGEAGEDTSATDLNFAVGLPWYLMLHGRDHARRSQPQARGQPRPQHPQMPRFGVPLVIGFNSGPVHGSPSDYAWGPQGLDDIISQMLANLEDSGPPPAKEEKIAELPKIVATKEDLALCAECSVCKEQFTVGEELLKMPCTHLYHNDCIIPWLKLHDTCPTCRYHLNTGKYEEESDSTT